MTLSLFGAFKAGRRKFLHSSIAVTLALPLATKASTTPVLEFDGFTYGPPKFKLGDRVSYEWEYEDEKFVNDDDSPIFHKVYQEGVVIGYTPNCQPETFYQEQRISQWSYYIYWLTSTLNSPNNLGVDLYCRYFDDELTLVSPASVSMGV